MTTLQFIDTNLFVSAASASLTSSNTKPPNLSIPYIHVKTRASETGEYINFLEVKYFYEDSEKSKLQLSLNLDATEYTGDVGISVPSRGILGNSYETLNAVYQRLSPNEINNILNSYSVEDPNYTFEQRYTKIYSACLALIVFIIYTSLINEEGLKNGDLKTNLFNPFNFKALAKDDDIDDLAEALNRDNFDYIEPSSLLAQNITNENPLIYALSLIFPWTQILSNFIPGPRSELSKQEGIFAAMSGVCCVFPQILYKVQSATKNTNTILNSYLECFNTDAEKSVRQISSSVETAHHTLNSYVDKVDDHTKESLQMIGTCKNTIVDRLRQEVSKCNTDIDTQRLASINEVIYTGECTMKSISTKESAVLTSLNDQISRVNTEVDSMLGAIQELQRSVQSKTRNVEERINNIDNKTSEVNELVESKKLELTDYCLMETNKMGSVIDDRKQDLCMAIDCKNRQTQESLDSFSIVVDEKMNDLNNVTDCINLKDAELKLKLSEVVADTDSKLDKIKDNIKNGCKNCLRKIHRETEESIDKIRKETYYSKKCLNDQTCCIENKLKDEMMTYVCSSIREKLAEQLKEEGRSLESEISTALHRQLNDDIIQKRVSDALKSVGSCRDGIIKDINSNYNELCQSLKISRDSFKLGTHNGQHINELRDQLHHCEKRLDALYDESPSHPVYPDQNGNKSQDTNDQLLDIVSKMQKRIDLLEETIRVMNSRLIY